MTGAVTWPGLGAAAAYLLAATFAWAAVGKLRRPAAVAAEFDHLGIRAPQVAARALPVAELATMALLIAVPWVGAAVALAMLAGFSVVLARQVRSGGVASCACFGAVADQPVSALDLVRNAGLALVAIVALAAERVVPSGAEAVAIVGLAAVAAAALTAARRRRAA